MSNLAVEAVRNRKARHGQLGVFWHRQGSGKSYSMAFFSEKVRRKLEGDFTFLVVIDRDDLDTQIYKTFAGCGIVNNQADKCRAASGKNLLELLPSNKPYIFTMIQKFNQDVNPENPYSKREDIIVISEVFSEDDYLLFDDTVADKNYSFQMELVRRQYSGNAKAIIKGIGIVTCVYVNPATNQFWLADYRLFAPEVDGKTKLDHVREMFDNAVKHKQLPLRAVLMDSWYAAKDLMLHIERSGKIYYCPLKSNRQADEGFGDTPKPNYQRVDTLQWTETELKTGKNLHLKDFPKGHRLQLFRLVVSTDRTDYVVTNDLTQHSTDATQKVCAVRWKIEQLHRARLTSNRLGALPMSETRNPKKSHRVCVVSLVSAQRTNVSNKTDDLSN